MSGDTAPRDPEDGAPRAASAAGAHIPSLRDRLRPLELLGLSAGVALFTGLIVLISTRDAVVALVFGGIGFVVALVIFAMLALTVAPTGEERLDLDEQDRGH